MHLGIWEIVLIALVVVIIFGARKLPELGQAIGTAIKNFQRALKGGDTGSGPEGE